MSMSKDMHAAHGGRPFWKSVFVSTTHCAAGCVIGDIIGAPTGWTLFGERLYAEYVVLFVLAYAFGIAFQYLPIRVMRRLSRRVALLEAIKADTLSLNAFEIGLFAWMAVVYLQFVPRPDVTSPTCWFMMQIGMVLGFIALSAELVSRQIWREGWHVSPLFFSTRTASLDRTVFAADDLVVKLSRTANSRFFRMNLSRHRACRRMVSPAGDCCTSSSGPH